MRKIKDRIFLGLVAGLIGNIPKAVSNELLFRKGIEKKRFGEIIAGIFLPAKQTKTKSGKIFGLGADFIVSAFMGVPLVYLLTFSGKDKFPIKGIFAGMVGFGALRGLLANVGPGKTYPKDVTTNAMMSWGSLLWGVTASFIAVILGDKSLFKPKFAQLFAPASDNAELSTEANAIFTTENTIHNPKRHSTVLKYKKLRAQ